MAKKPPKKAKKEAKRPKPIVPVIPIQPAYEPDKLDSSELLKKLEDAQRLLNKYKDDLAQDAKDRLRSQMIQLMLLWEQREEDEILSLMLSA